MALCEISPGPLTQRPKRIFVFCEQPPLLLQFKANNGYFGLEMCVETECVQLFTPCPCLPPLLGFVHKTIYDMTSDNSNQTTIIIININNKQDNEKRKNDGNGG